MRVREGVLGLVMLGTGLTFGISVAGAASHREAPLMTLDPAADISDVYAFVSYDAANLARPLAQRNVTLIMNALRVPSSPSSAR